MRWYSTQVKAAAETKAAEVFIYGDIGESWWDETVTAKEFVKEIAALDVEQLTVRINSVGGSVPDGLAIYNALKRHKASVTIAIDGMAMSIASLIAMAGDTVEMAENAILMIHAPWTYAGGNAADLREAADVLDKWAEAMSTSYAAKTGKTAEEILALLTDGVDHYYTAAEALEAGFVDSVTPALAIAASADMAAARARFTRSPSVAAAANAPAAPAASLQQETPMSGTNTPAAAPQPATPSAAEILAADKTRREGIRGAFAKFTGRPGIAELQQQCEDDHDCTPEAAAAKLLAKLGENAAPIAGGHVVTVEDERDKFRAGVANSIMARAGLAKSEGNNQFRGYTLYEIARASLSRAGRSADGMDKMSVVAAAFTHSGSDFPLLLANVAEKAMLKGYEEAEETFQLWTSVGNLPDFKEASRVDLNTFPSLLKVAEGAEYKYATVGERGEKIQLATYGRLFSITRQAIINDDLDAFSKIPRAMGRASIRTVGDLVYAVLTSNPAMADGTALFHADHKNLLTGAAPLTASVDAMRVAMGKQTDGNSTLNIRLANLIVPLALGGTCRTIRDSQNEIVAGKNATAPNSVRGTFEVIEDARLDAASSTVWYGAANPAMHDTIEVSYLDGNQAPTLEQQGGWNIDGVDFKVRLDAGVKALDFRTLAKNPG